MVPQQQVKGYIHTQGRMALLHGIQLFTFASGSVGYSSDCTVRWHTPTQTVRMRICTSFMAQEMKIHEKHGDSTDDYQTIRHL